MNKKSSELSRIKNFIRAVCPYYNRYESKNDDLSISKDEFDSGWYFTCRLCQEVECTGYMADD